MFSRFVTWFSIMFNYFFVVNYSDYIDKWP